MILQMYREYSGLVPQDLGMNGEAGDSLKIWRNALGFYIV